MLDLLQSQLMDPRTATLPPLTPRFKIHDNTWKVILAAAVALLLLLALLGIIFWSFRCATQSISCVGAR